MSTTVLQTVPDTWLCTPDLKAKKRDSALTQLADWAVQAGVAREAGLLASTLARRERFASSAIGKGVALPHARSVCVREARLVVARAPRGIEWDETADGPVNLVVVALAPSEFGELAFYDLIARGAALVRLQRHRQRLLETGDAVERLALVKEIEA